MSFLPLEKLHQLYDGYRRIFRIEGEEWVLIQDEGKVHLIQNRCPHLGAPLSQATQAEGELRCPRHGMTFSLMTGHCLSDSAVSRLVKRPLIYEGNQIGVDM